MTAVVKLAGMKYRREAIVVIESDGHSGTKRVDTILLKCQCPAKLNEGIAYHLFCVIFQTICHKAGKIISSIYHVIFRSNKMQKHLESPRRRGMRTVMVSVVFLSAECRVNFEALGSLGPG